MRGVVSRARAGLGALVTVSLLAGGALGAETPASPKLPAPSEVLRLLNGTVSWYQESRAVMRSLAEVDVPSFGRDNDQTALRVLQAAFDTANAQLAVLAASEAPSTGAGSAGTPSRNRAAQVRADIERDEGALKQLRERIASSPASARGALEREAAATSNRLDLNRLRLNFITKLQELNSADESPSGSLAREIQTLQDTVPELHPAGTAGEVAAAPFAPPATSSTSTWDLIRRLVALRQGRRSLEDLSTSTAAVRKDVEAALHTAADSGVKPILARLNELAKDPSPTGAPLAEGEQQFHDLLEQAKRLSAVVLPLRAESSLLQRFSGQLVDSRRSVDRLLALSLENLGIQLAGVVLAIAGILIGARLWRLAALRYLASPYHRRVVLSARNVVVVAAIVLVLVFHFTSELTALVTALGFAAAGIAFALQNVILSMAGYFSMVAPNGIRVGDRVSLQGPFGYVNGEVVEIGLVRMRLRELSGSPLEPTGRTVVFPNSVVFTGSFFKHPPSAPATS